ncbi:MAG: hypothetical protein ACXQS7_01995 [Candidatus Syntropharchaeia archaeon]
MKEECEKVKKLGDKLSEIDSLIGWKAFRLIVAGMYRNKTEKGEDPTCMRRAPIRGIVSSLPLVQLKVGGYNTSWESPQNRTKRQILPHPQSLMKDHEEPILIPP